MTLAARWVIDRGNTVALWGARHAEQLGSVEQVMGWQLDRETLDEIDRILRDTILDPVGPEFMAPPETAPERPRSNRWALLRRRVSAEAAPQ